MATSSINVTAQLNEPLFKALFAVLQLATTALARGQLVDPMELIQAMNAELLNRSEVTDE